jgi:hypothetical protein
MKYPGWRVNNFGGGDYPRPRRFFTKTERFPPDYFSHPTEIIIQVLEN